MCLLCNYDLFQCWREIRGLCLVAPVSDFLKGRRDVCLHAHSSGRVQRFGQFLHTTTPIKPVTVNEDVLSGPVIYFASPPWPNGSVTPPTSC